MIRQTSDSTADDVSQGEVGKEARKGGVRWLSEWVIILGLAVLGALVIKTFLIQAFFIPSASMEHTLDVGDRVLVNKLSYRLHPINRGDIVVFDKPAIATKVDALPNGAPEPLSNQIIKRVIAVGGDSIEIQNNRVLVNDLPIEEPYLARGVENLDFDRQIIQPGKIFVMGDNRTQSRDSRSIGPIDESQVIGRAFVLVWPISNFAWL